MTSVTRLTEAAERLVQLYDEWGKPAEAAKWRKELAAAQSRLLPQPDSQRSQEPVK